MKDLSDPPAHLGPTPDDRKFEREHEWLDRRSLAMHRWIALILQSNPDLLEEKTRPVILRWKTLVDQRNIPYLDAWLEVLDQGPEAVVDMISRDDEHARAMRQSSPFVNILTPQQRQAMLNLWRRNYA